MLYHCWAAVFLQLEGDWLQGCTALEKFHLFQEPVLKFVHQLRIAAQLLKVSLHDILQWTDGRLKSIMIYIFQFFSVESSSHELKFLFLFCSLLCCLCCFLSQGLRQPQLLVEVQSIQEVSRHYHRCPLGAAVSQESQRHVDVSDLKAWYLVMNFKRLLLTSKL